MNRKLVLLSIALLAMLMVSAFPVKAWIYPDEPDDNKFELYGPHVAGILIKLYTNEEAEWEAMDNDLIDFEDWPLTQAWIDEWTGDPRFRLAGYGGEAGYFIVDMNNNPNLLLADGSPNPAIDPEMGINVFSVLSLKQALACLVNRSYIVNTICSGLALPMYTAVPRYMTTYVHPDIVPGGTLDYLTYGGYYGDVAKAVQYLEDDGFHYDAGLGHRYYDQNGNDAYDAGEEFTLIFYSRSDSGQRFAFANDYVVTLTSAPISLDIDYRPNIRAVCSDHVFGAKEFHMYTGGWIFIGPDPDFLYDLYHSSCYGHPGKPSNYGYTTDALLDQYASDIKFATTIPGAVTGTMAFSKRFAEIVQAVPLWCASGVKAYRRVPVEEPGLAEWLGVVNQAGFGVNSWWTFLNLMKECEYYPPIYATYGFMSPTIEWRNPVYAQWYWDWEFIGKIYDGCAARNPYDLGLWVPQLAKAWEVGTWIDPNTHAELSKVRITLRPDLLWSDGTPVTVADIAYTLVESCDALLEKGLPTPWWYPTVQYFRSFFIIDPLNIEILLDVKSVFAVGWVIGNVIIPKHIWKPLIDISTQQNNVVYGPQPDPLVIGSGPYKYVSYTPNVNAVLDANPLYWQFCPVHVNVATTDYKVKKDPGFPNTVTTVDIEVKIYNLWLNDSFGGVLDGMKYVYVDNVLYEQIPVVALRSGRPAFGFPKMVLQPMAPWNPPVLGTPFIEVAPMAGWQWTLTSHADTNLNGIVDPGEMLDFQDGFGNVMIANAFQVNPFPGPLMLDYYEIYHYEEFTIPLSKCKREIKVAFHIESPQMIDDIHPNPWLCQWINVTLPVWITIKQDIGGATYLGKVVAPDCKVDGKDIAYAASAFGTTPGMRRWNSVADVTADYKVDGKDVANIAKYFGKW